MGCYLFNVIYKTGETLLHCSCVVIELSDLSHESFFVRVERRELIIYLLYLYPIFYIMQRKDPLYCKCSAWSVKDIVGIIPVLANNGVF